MAQKGRDLAPSRPFRTSWRKEGPRSDDRAPRGNLAWPSAPPRGSSVQGLRGVRLVPTGEGLFVQQGVCVEVATQRWNCSCQRFTYRNICHLLDFLRETGF